MNLETSKARERLSPFCVGNGVDVGFGGDPIIQTAITVDVVNHPGLNLLGDARDLYWFKDGVLDYLYSSHLLEDFEDTWTVLFEWFRVVKKGGYLVLFGPDQKIYKQHCIDQGQCYNINHKIDNFGLDYLKGILRESFKGQYEIVHEIGLVDEYSFDLVLRKVA